VSIASPFCARRSETPRGELNPARSVDWIGSTLTRSRSVRQIGYRARCRSTAIGILFGQIRNVGDSLLRKLCVYQGGTRNKVLVAVDPMESKPVNDLPHQEVGEWLTPILGSRLKYHFVSALRYAGKAVAG
jgi:hypothetical protein